MNTMALCMHPVGAQVSNVGTAAGWAVSRKWGKRHTIDEGRRVLTLRCVVGVAQTPGWHRFPIQICPQGLAIAAAEVTFPTPCIAYKTLLGGNQIANPQCRCITQWQVEPRPAAQQVATASAPTQAGG